MRRIRWLALFAALALVVAACTSNGTGSTTTTPAPTTTGAPSQTTTTPPASGAEKVIIIGTTDSVANLDSADAYAVHDWEIIRNTGVALTTFVPGTTEIAPGLAESWDISDDGTVYTFHLRDDVVYGDGTPLTAEIYVRHLNRLLNLAPEGVSGVGGSLGTPYIACATPGTEEGSCDEWGVRAVDGLTVEITLQGAFGFFPQLVAGAPFVPSHPSLPEDALVLIPTEFPFYGVGPWIMESFTASEQSVFVPNPHFYGDAPKVDRIIIRYYAGEPQLVAALEGGDIDIAWRSVSDPSLLDQLDAMDGITAATVPGGGIRYFILNHEMEPTNNHMVRQAIAAAIDRDELVDRAFGGYAEPLYSQIPPGFTGATEIFDDVYGSPNLDEAIRLLTAAGFTESAPLELTIDYPPNRYGDVVADAVAIVADQLERTGLISVTAVPTDWATYLTNQVTGAHAMGFLGWFFDFPDSSNYTDTWLFNGGLGSEVTSRDGANTPSANLVSPQLITLAQEAGTESDIEARAALYEEIQELWANDVVTIPLWMQPERVFYGDHISANASAANANSLNIGPETTFNWAVLDTSK